MKKNSFKTKKNFNNTFFNIFEKNIKNFIKIYMLYDYTMDQLELFTYHVCSLKYIYISSFLCRIQI